MNTRLNQTASKRGQGIACVDSDCPILGLHPLPLASAVAANLQRSDGLAEEQGERAEVGVPTAPEAKFRVLLGRELAVFHVAEMVLGEGAMKIEWRRRRGFVHAHLALRLVGVDLEEVVLGELEGDSQKDVKRVKDFGVERLIYA